MLHCRPGRSLKLAAFGPQNDSLDRFDRPYGRSGLTHSNFNKMSVAE
jgi:hypothetical protein